MSITERYVSAFVISIIAVFCHSPAAQAQSPQQLKWCQGKGSATPDQQIGGCTAAIESGKFEGKNLAVAFFNRGNAYSSKGQYDRAIENYDQAIKINPQYAKAFFNRGNTYSSKGQYDRAIENYDQAITINPQSAVAFNDRAWIQHKKGEDASGLPDAEKAVALDPKNAAIIETRAEIYEKLSQRDKALADYRAALNLAPELKSAQDGLKRLNGVP